VVGDSLYCVYMFSYSKDGDHYWVALAVQSVDTPKSTLPNETTIDWTPPNETDKPLGIFSRFRNSRANPRQRTPLPRGPGSFGSSWYNKFYENSRPVYSPDPDLEGYKDEVKETFTRVGLIEARRLPGSISVDWFKDIKTGEIFLI